MAFCPMPVKPVKNWALHLNLSFGFLYKLPFSPAPTFLTCALFCFLKKLRKLCPNLPKRVKELQCQSSLDPDKTRLAPCTQALPNWVILNDLAETAGHPKILSSIPSIESLCVKAAI